MVGQFFFTWYNLLSYALVHLLSSYLHIITCLAVTFSVWLGQLCDTSDEGSLGGIFHALSWSSISHDERPCEQFPPWKHLMRHLRMKEEGFGRMRRQASEPNTSFLNLLLCWNDCERWWMADITLKCLLSLRVILPIFQWT